LFSTGKRRASTRPATLIATQTTIQKTAEEAGEHETRDVDRDADNDPEDRATAERGAVAQHPDPERHERQADTAGRRFRRSGGEGVSDPAGRQSSQAPGGRMGCRVVEAVVAASVTDVARCR